MSNKEKKLRERCLRSAHETAFLIVQKISAEIKPLPFAETSDTLIETPEQANAAYDRINKTKADAIGLGRFLTEKQIEVGHGNWLAYVDRWLKFGPDTAQRYMRIYKHRAHMPHACGFSVRAALKICDRIENKTRKAKKIKTASDAIRDFSDDDVVSALLNRISLEALMRVIQRQA